MHCLIVQTYLIAITMYIEELVSVKHTCA